MKQVKMVIITEVTDEYHKEFLEEANESKKDLESSDMLNEGIKSVVVTVETTKHYQNAKKPEKTG